MAVTSKSFCPLGRLETWKSSKHSPWNELTDCFSKGINWERLKLGSAGNSLPSSKGGVLFRFYKHFGEEDGGGHAQMPKDNFNPLNPKPEVSERSLIMWYHMHCLTLSFGKHLSLHKEFSIVFCLNKCRSLSNHNAEEKRRDFEFSGSL